MARGVHLHFIRPVCEKCVQRKELVRFQAGSWINSVDAFWSELERMSTLIIQPLIQGLNKDR